VPDGKKTRSLEKSAGMCRVATQADGTSHRDVGCVAMAKCFDTRSGAIPLMKTNS
jgi:hypothetical protein